jgi:hypothetical protein
MNHAEAHADQELRELERHRITVVYPAASDHFVSPCFGVSVRVNFKVGDIVAFLERFPDKLRFGQDLKPPDGCDRAFFFHDVPPIAVEAFPYLLVIMARAADGCPVLPAVRPLRVRAPGPSARDPYGTIHIIFPGDQATVSPTFGTYGSAVCTNTKAVVLDGSGAKIGDGTAVTPAPMGMSWGFTFLTPLRPTPDGEWDTLRVSADDCMPDNHAIRISS